MISNVLLNGSIVLVIFSYLLVLTKYFVYKKKKIDNYSGFDGAKEVTSNYEEINIVNSSDVIFSEYDAKRNVIRLNNRNYDGNSYFDVAISMILAGYSLVNNNNSSYFKFKTIIKKINYLGFVSLIGVVLSCFVGNIGDAKLGIVFVLLLAVYQYMRYQIIFLANDEIKEVIDKDVYDKVCSIINTIINFNKISFIVMLILLMRLVVIILGM